MVTHKIEKFNICFPKEGIKITEQDIEEVINAVYSERNSIRRQNSEIELGLNNTSSQVRFEDDHLVWEYSPSFNELSEQLREEYLEIANNYGRN